MNNNQCTLQQCPPNERIKPRLRRNRRLSGKIVVAAATAATIAVSLSFASAFQATSTTTTTPSSTLSSTTTAPRLTSDAKMLSRTSHPPPHLGTTIPYPPTLLPRSSSRRRQLQSSVSLADSDLQLKMFLMNDIPSTITANNNNRGRRDSDSDSTVNVVYKEAHDGDDEMQFLTASSLSRYPQGATTEQRLVKFKSVSQSPSRTTTRTLPAAAAATSGSSSKRRSSTMPGFSGGRLSDRQRAYRDGIRMVEQRTGKIRQETPAAREKRKRENGDAMYRNSASVPDSLVQFAEEIHREDRITRNEEIELGELTQEALRLQNLYDNLEAKLARKPTDEEWCAAAGKINMEAIGQAIEDGLEAKNKLVASNLRMVQSVVNTYIRNGLSARYNAGDMMQEGIIALIRAAEKFEPDRGWKFSTYAMYWVRASVKRSQIYQSRIIPVPQRLHENHKRLLRTEKELYSVLGRKPTKSELGSAVGMSETQVERCFTAMQLQCYSLDQEIRNTLKPNSGDIGGNTLIEVVDAKTDDGDYRRQEQQLLREALIDTLNRHLEPDEVEVLLLRYGLKDVPHTTTSGPRSSGQLLTIAELSRIVDLKPDKVRRMITRSLKQLKAIGVEEWLSFEIEL